MLIFLGSAFLSVAAAFLLGARGIVLAGVALVVMLAVVLADRHFGEIFDRWSRGAAGERKVGALLEQLIPEGWHVLHDVSLGRGNIDHVVVGPAGAFTVETKSHRGRRRVDRLDARMLSQAYAEKKLLERVSGLKVEPLLVFSEGWLVGTVPARRKGVTVLPARMLPGHLKRCPPVMSPVEAAEIGETLRLALEVDAVN